MSTENPVGPFAHLTSSVEFQITAKDGEISRFEISPPLSDLAPRGEPLPLSVQFDFVPAFELFSMGNLAIVLGGMRGRMSGEGPLQFHYHPQLFPS